MAELRTVEKSTGHYLKGDVVQIDDELRFVVTNNPTIDTTNGNLIWFVKTDVLSAWRLRDESKLQDILSVDTMNDVVTIHPPYAFAGGDSNVVATTLSSWTLDAGTIYYADVTHNFASDDILIEIFDSVTKETVQVEKIDRTDTNTARIFIDGNTASLRVVVINGLTSFQGSSGRNVVTSPSTPYTAANNDIIIWDCTSGNKVLNLPAAASSNNFRIDVKKLDATANTLTIDPNGAELIESGATAVLTSQGEAISIICNGAAWYILASL